MSKQIIEIILSSAKESFLAVGVFVAIILLIIGIINNRYGTKLIQTLNSTRKFQPILGALLGLIPGCGGAIFVMPLYLKGKVSYGTVIAALVATMGDSAFVLISSNPDKFLLVSVISVIAAIITGYAIDFLKIDGGFAKKREKRLQELQMKREYHDEIQHSKILHVAHEEGDEADVLFHHQDEKHKNWVYDLKHGQFYIFFWIITCIGIIFGLLSLFQVDISGNPFMSTLGSIVGITGTLLCIIYIIINRKMIKKDELEEEEHKLESIREILIHGAVDVAFVTSWVFVAFLIYNFSILAVGGEQTIQSWMMASGIIAVITGALIGLIPGSGPQIIFVSLYSSGLIPFAALIANAISQDGDALFPLLAIDRKSSIVATLITTVPAMLIGLIWYFVV